MKNAAVYGIWIDDKRVTNKALDKYKATDFSGLGISKLYGVAKKGRSHKRQANLSTNAYYENYSKKVMADVSYAIMIMPAKAKWKRLSLSSSHLPILNFQISNIKFSNLKYQIFKWLF